MKHHIGLEGAPISYYSPKQKVFRQIKFKELILLAKYHGNLKDTITIYIPANNIWQDEGWTRIRKFSFRSKFPYTHVF